MIVKKLDEQNKATTVNLKLDETLACVIEVFHTLEALQTNKADKRFEMTFTSSSKSNRETLMKQARQYQRNNDIYFSKDNSKTHYDVYANVKRKVLRVDKVMKVNHIKIFNHHVMSRSEYLAYHADLKANTDAANTDAANTANADTDTDS